MRPGDIYRNGNTGSYEIVIGVDKESKTFVHTLSNWTTANMYAERDIGKLARVNKVYKSKPRNKIYIGNIWEIIKEVDPHADISTLQEFLDNG